jgi:serine/threonine protein kinase
VTVEGDPLLRDGAQLGRYRVLRRIGSGGMATVYEAEHAELEKRVALKTLHPALALDPEARALQVFRRVPDGWLLALITGGDGAVRAEPFDAIELDLGALWSW